MSCEELGPLKVNESGQQQYEVGTDHGRYVIRLVEAGKWIAIRLSGLIGSIAAEGDDPVAVLEHIQSEP